jgi:hypothetical protein
LRVICPPRVPFQRRGRVAFLIPQAPARARWDTCRLTIAVDIAE